MIRLTTDKKGVFHECAQEESERYIFTDTAEYSSLSNFEWTDLRARAWQDDVKTLNYEVKNAEPRVAELDAEIAELQEKISKQDETEAWFRSTMHEYDRETANSLRIARERANAERNLRPKKQHHGYIIVRLDQEKTFAGYNADGKGVNVIGYRATVETPYPAAANIEDIVGIILNELTEKVFHGEVKILNCGPDEFPEEARNENVVYRFEFHASFKDLTPLWTITLHSIHPLDITELLP